jgi:hypothetical protein
VLGLVQGSHPAQLQLGQVDWLHRLAPIRQPSRPPWVMSCRATHWMSSIVTK